MILAECLVGFAVLFLLLCFVWTVWYDISEGYHVEEPPIFVTCIGIIVGLLIGIAFLVLACWAVGHMVMGCF